MKEQEEQSQSVDDERAKPILNEISVGLRELRVMLEGVDTGV